MALSREPQSVWPLGALLGEGPVWVERDQALWFVDIKSHKVHRFTDGGDRRTWDAPGQIGFALPADRGGFVAGLQGGLFHFDGTSGRFSPLADVEPHLPDNRLNDGVVDPSGRLWFGSMDDAERTKSGAFYRFQHGRVAPTGIDGITITNGPAVSPDGRLLYVVDTLGGMIRVADIGLDGTLSAPRAFVQIDPVDGHPDGPTVDAEGCVWIGLYGGWGARRYAPTGELLQQVRFPVANVTKLAFGGPDRRTVYATTASQKMGPDELAKQPQAGDLFSFRADVEGLPCPLVAT